MANKICDFCLEEGSGLFNQPTKLRDGHYICRNCREIIENYNLPVKYDLFQLLVTAEPNMREMMMGDYLETHSAEEVYAKYYPIPNMILHDGEHCINARKAKVRVLKSLIPEDKAPERIADVAKNNISNIPNAPSESGSAIVEGMLYETDAALYFMSEHFVNCHRTTNMVRNSGNKKVIMVLEHGKQYTYAVPNADLFLLRSTFYHMAGTNKENRRKSLIYLQSENTMTLTSGSYSVPKNIKSGIYYVNPVNEADLSVIDANGKSHSVTRGRIRIDEGSRLEVTGQYEFRFRLREKGEQALQETSVIQTIDEMKDLEPMSDETKQFEFPVAESSATETIRIDNVDSIPSDQTKK